METSIESIKDDFLLFIYLDHIQKVKGEETQLTKIKDHRDHTFIYLWTPSH